MLELIRGATRPLVVVLVVLATALFIWHGKAIPEPWWVMAGAPVGWWFWDRTARRQA